MNLQDTVNSLMERAQDSLIEEVTVSDEGYHLRSFIELNTICVRAWADLYKAPRLLVERREPRRRPITPPSVGFNRCYRSEWE